MSCITLSRRDERGWGGVVLWEEHEVSWKVLLDRTTQQT